MPIYAYRCEGCGFQKDALQKLSDPPLTDCPQCGEPKLAKQLTAAGFALKGTGWYVTDFRNKGATADASKADVPKGEASKADASKADAPKVDAQSSVASTANTATPSPAAASGTAPTTPAASSSAT